MHKDRNKDSLAEAERRFYELGEVNNELKAVVIEPAKTVYLAVPKAANSSAKVALCPTLGIDRSLIQSQSDIHSNLIPTVPADEALARAAPDWFVFTIVRHPYQRAYSAWRDKLDRSKERFKPLATMGLQRGDSFELFLKTLNAWPRLLLNDHFIPQSDLLSKAFTRPDLRIYHMEDLGTGWIDICDQLEARGVPRPDPIPMINSSGPQAPMKFSFRARRHLRRLYGRDFKPLNYRKPFLL